MKIVTLLLKVKVKSVSPYALMDSSLFLCGLLLKSVMGQLLVGWVVELTFHLVFVHVTHAILVSAFIVMITALYLVHIAMDFLLAAWVCVVSQLYSLFLCELLLRSVMGQLLVGCVCHWV